LNVGFDVRIIEEGVIDWDEPTVITGFPGPGFVGETTAMYIVDSLQLREIGHVDSELIPPMLVVMGPSLRPPFRIHASEAADLIIIVDNQPIPMEHHRALSRKLMDWLDGKDVKEVIVLDGLPLPDETLEGRVIGFSTREEKLSELSRYGVLPLTGGAVTGMNAALLEICQERGMPWTGLLAPTRRIASPNWRGITSIIEVLNKILDLDVDASTMTKSVGGSVEQAPVRTREPRKEGIFGVFRRRTRT
jgi:uncharacterized protein